MKLYLLLFVVLVSIFSAKAQKPVIWQKDSNCLINGSPFVFPFDNKTILEDGTTYNNDKVFDVAVIYFQKSESFFWFLGFDGDIAMRFRVFLNSTVEDLRMKDLPELYVKLGDGTILKGSKDRIDNFVSNYQNCFEVYFDLDSGLQEKILKSGIEKVRFAYVFTYMGIIRNQIFDAYSKNCLDKGLNAGMFLQQVKNADLKKVKQDAEKNNLNFNF